MMGKRNWARWIHQSLAIYLQQVAIDAAIPVIVEGIHDRQPSFMDASDRLEVRVNGPFSREISLGYYHVQVDANVLLSSRMDGQSKDV
jgi:hypothetical protein